MKSPNTKGRIFASALLSSLILLGCNSDKPETMLVSAKEYLAKNDSKAAVIQLKNALQANPNLAEARFLLGKSLLEGGSPAAAEVELRKARDLKYADSAVVPLIARAMLSLGQAKKVTDDFANLQVDSPEGNAELRTMVAQALLVQGKTESAQSMFEKALSFVPAYGPAIVGQARIKAASRDLAGALTLLEGGAGGGQKSPEAFSLKGDILAAKGDRDASKEAYLKALELKSDFIPAHAALTGVYLAAGKLDEASAQLESLKKVAPSSPAVHYLQAELSLRKTNFKAASEAIQQYLRLLPDSPQGLLLAGMIEYELKSYSTAETHLLKVLPKTPDLGMARRILISTYLRSGQPEKALSMLQPILDKAESNSNILALAGEVFMQNGQAEKANAYFVKASKLDPENKQKQTSAAISRLAKGETELAYHDLEKIASTDTGVSADMALIASQMKGQQFDRALKSIDNLEKKQVENPLVSNLRGMALLGKRDVAAARKSFELALSKNPAYFPAAANLANLDLADKKVDDARKRFESVLEKDPKNTQSWLTLAELQAKTGGKPEDIAALINKAVNASPSDPSPRIALVSLYLSAKDTKKAESVAQEALAVLPDNPQILDVAGRAQQANGNLNQALTTYGKLVSIQPTAVHPHLRVAEIQVVSKNKEAAMQSLRKALSIQPESVEAQRGIMMLDLDAGRTGEALKTARQVQKQQPKSPLGYMFEGDIQAVQKDWREAANAYRNGIARTGATELAVKLHAVLMSQANTASEAERFSESWLKDHAKDERFRLYLAESANARKNYGVAAKHYRQLVDNHPENPAFLNNLAWTLGQVNDPKAVEYAEKAMKLAPQQPGVIDTLGTLLVAKGDVDKGLELLKKANSLAPKDPAIRLNLAKALVKASKKDEAKKELEELAKLGEQFAGQAEVKELLDKTK